MKKVKQPVAIACLFTWIGFVCAISFMEAWLKFRAPGVTLPVGLGIGRLVFGALNRVEWVFAVVVCASAVAHNKPLGMAGISVFTAAALLVLQTAWLLPALDARAELYIQGRSVPPSSLHWWFTGAEMVKVAGLFIAGVSLFKQS